MKGRNNKRRAARKLQANLPSKAAALTVCTVCGSGDGKYKCPKCRAPFCCVQCSRDHKATCACPAITAGAKSTSTAKLGSSSSSIGQTASSTAPIIVEPSKYLPSDYSTSSVTTTTTTTESFNLQHPHKRLRRRSKDDDDDDDDSHNGESGWIITPEMKARIQQSSWLRKELQDGGLRQLIDTIDAASDVQENDFDDDEKGNDEKSDAHGRMKRNWNKKRGNYSKYATTISARELTLARTKHAHPKFASFTDRLLLLAGVLQPAAAGAGGAEDGGGEFIISDVGMLEGSNHHGHLVLAPVPRSNNRTLLKSSTSGTEGEEEEEEDENGSKNSCSSNNDSEDGSSSSSSEEDSDESNDCAEE